MVKRYDDDDEDKSVVYVNGYAVSYAYPYWQAVKKGTAHFRHLKKDEVIKWAEKQ